MMAKKKTAQKSSLNSWQEVDECLRSIAEANTTVEKREADMNKRILVIQQSFEQETRDVRDSIVAHEKNVELFCKEHRDEFVPTKTRTLNYGFVSFRNAAPKLSCLRGFTWETVIALMKKLDMTQYIRTKEEVDKDLVKTELTDAADLAQIGLHIDQDEQFYYEVNRAELVS
jgi:phage host-nuclease inhibitor protein Gam